MYISS